MNGFENEITGLWRSAPPEGLPAVDDKSINRYLFPGARQSITCALKLKGLGREHRVAVPEWSSHCVISAVSQCCTPIPLREVVDYNIPVDALLLYEQWGWPFNYAKIVDLLEKRDGLVIVCDRVDSCNIARPAYSPPGAGMDLIEVFSLFKLLGTPGGGLLRINGKYIVNSTESHFDNLTEILWSTPSARIEYPRLLDLHKGAADSLHPDLKRWSEKYSFFHAVQREEKFRRKHLRSFMDSPLSSDWPRWMFSAFEKGAAPGIVPLFRGRTIEEIDGFNRYIYDEFNIRCAVYHFNFSGDPMDTAYEKCLAFPIHGQVGNLEKIIARIE